MVFTPSHCGAAQLGDSTKSQHFPSVLLRLQSLQAQCAPAVRCRRWRRWLGAPRCGLSRCLPLPPPAAGRGRRAHSSAAPPAPSRGRRPAAGRRLQVEGPEFRVSGWDHWTTYVATSRCTRCRLSGSVALTCSDCSRHHNNESQKGSLAASSSSVADKHARHDPGC